MLKLCERAFAETKGFGCCGDSSQPAHELSGSFSLKVRDLSDGREMNEWAHSIHLLLVPNGQ